MTSIIIPRVFLYASPRVYKMLKVVKYLYTKYMPGVIVNILGHGPAPIDVPFDHIFMFISIGKYLNNPDEWSVDIANFIRKLKNEPYFIFSFADFLLIDYVNTNVLIKCIQYLTTTNRPISSIRLASIIITSELITDMIIYKDDDMILYTNRIGRSSHKFSLWKTEEFVKAFERPCSIRDIMQYGVISEVSLVCYTTNEEKSHLREVIPSTVHSASVDEKKISVLGLKNEDLTEIIKQNLADEASLVFTYRENDRQIPFVLFNLPIYKEELSKHGISPITWVRYGDIYPSLLYDEGENISDTDCIIA